jgi:hypothetical protein
MAKIRYIPRKFAETTLLIIAMANRIINEYQAQGFDLTLRQLYYQFIGRDLFPDSWIDEVYNRKHKLAPGTKNTDKNYDRLGSIISDARLAGLIDWLAIVDRTRSLRGLSNWDSPQDIMSGAERSYHRDLWATQLWRPEVWIEKDALLGVFAGVCNEWDTPYFSCRGYTSLSEMWVASQRILKYIKDGQAPIIFHFGDHDPSGRDMTRDIRDRLEMFTDHQIQVKRMALNWKQIEKYGPPPNPTKLTDSRARAYVAEFGFDSWELDSMEPQVLANLVSAGVRSILNKEVWSKAVQQQETERAQLKAARENWDRIQKALAKPKEAS